MIQNTKKILLADGHELILNIFMPAALPFHEANCNGVILAVHGLTEYAERYKSIAEATCNKNKVFACFNLRGHGENPLKRGDVQDFSSFILDIITAFFKLRQLFPQVKKESFAIFGHSFGGLLTTYATAVIGSEVKKIFLSAPGYASQQIIPQWKIMLAKTVPKIYPELTVPIGLNPKSLSSNPENNKAYKTDPLILKTLTARFGEILLDSMNPERIKNLAQEIMSEVTIIIPSNDEIVNSEVTKKLIASFKSKVNAYEIEGCGHESFFERDEIKKIAFSYYENWLDTI